MTCLCRFLPHKQKSEGSCALDRPRAARSRANPDAILQAIAEVSHISTDEYAPLSNFAFCYRKDSKELGVIQCGDFIETPLVM